MALSKRAGIAVIVLGLAIGAWYFRPIPALRPGGVDGALELSRGDRLLIVAPHSDDEVLPSAGLIQRALEAGADVHVALMTNGDGFRVAVEREFRRMELAPEDYIHFAYKRQSETAAGLSVLGLKPRQITYLGYPDGGLAEMWVRHWEASIPYWSPRTKTSHSPYANAPTRNAPFAGEAVIRDLLRVIEEQRPTVVVYPHPNDMHVDHWATNAFVNYTLQLLQQEERGQIRRLTYLVHRGAWPRPQGLHVDAPLTPPAALRQGDTGWHHLPLSRGQVRRKREALERYQSQLEVMGAYLRSFVRRNEVFGVQREVINVPTGRATVDGSSADWGGETATLFDPRRDGLAERYDGRGDILGVWMRADAAHLYVRVDLAKPPFREAAYRLMLTGIAESPDAMDQARRLAVVVEPPDKIWLLHPSRLDGQVGQAPAVAGLAARTLETTIEFSIPRSALGTGRLWFAGFDVKKMGMQVDRAQIRLVQLPD